MTKPPKPARATDVEYWLEEISDALKLESWFEGKSLTVMVPDEDGERKLVKLRFASVLDGPTATDLRGEPE